MGQDEGIRKILLIDRHERRRIDGRGRGRREQGQRQEEKLAEQIAHDDSIRASPRRARPAIARPPLLSYKSRSERGGHDDGSGPRALRNLAERGAGRIDRARRRRCAPGPHPHLRAAIHSLSRRRLARSPTRASPAALAPISTGRIYGRDGRRVANRIRGRPSPGLAGYRVPAIRPKLRCTAAPRDSTSATGSFCAATRRARCSGW